ncbi:MAG: phytanoyl-CoA dioxygenase family protein [Candidatus Latescibacterota bacterium]|nr:phytanoyl-CoA dioxygenase family protein [Candidatus Latescibacterota bacterium]
MDKDQMTNEENYHFDVAGFLHIPGVLNSGEVSRVNQTLDEVESQELISLPEGQREPFRELLVHPQLVWYLNQIVGPGFKLDTLPEILGSDPSTIDRPLPGGNEPLDPGTAYFFKNGRRHCQGVRVIWVLSDVKQGESGLTIIPHTHRGNTEIPEDVRTGKDDMGLTLQPALKAGDLLIIGLSVVHGVRSTNNEARLLSYEYTGRGVLRSAGKGHPVETYERHPWDEHLSDVQRASQYKPGYRETSPAPTIITDGKTARLGKPGDRFHPSIYIKNPDANIDEKEFFFWDLCGYLVVRGVMDEEWLATANEAMDVYEDQIQLGDSNTAGKSESLAGTPRPELHGLFEMPGKYGEAFRKMIAHPPIEHRLNWMGGNGLRTGGATAICSVDGTAGHTIHSNGQPLNPSRQWFYQNGRSYCQAPTCTWQLRDVTEADGGFVCVPGSHHANYSMPRGVTTCDDPMDLVKHIEMKAGDVLFFADGSTGHGTYAWRGPLSRRGILIKYQSRNFNRGGGVPVHPENRWGNIVDGMTDAQMAVMRGADRDNFGNNVPRLDVVNGEINVTYERGGSLYSADTPAGPVAPSS